MSQIPAGYRKPYESVTPDDHTAWIVIAATIGIIYSIIFLGFRVFIRRTSGLGRLSVDDLIVVVGTVRTAPNLLSRFSRRVCGLINAQVLAFIQSATVLAACNNGLGKRWSILSSEMQQRVQQVQNKCFEYSPRRPRAK